MAVCQFIALALEMKTDQCDQSSNQENAKKGGRNILWQLIVVFNVVIEKRISVFVSWILISSGLRLSSLLYCLRLPEQNDLLVLTICSNLL